MVSLAKQKISQFINLKCCLLHTQKSTVYNYYGSLVKPFKSPHLILSDHNFQWITLRLYHPWGNLVERIACLIWCRSCSAGNVELFPLKQNENNIYFWSLFRMVAILLYGQTHKYITKLANPHAGRLVKTS